jgi:hypothetical protein
MRLVKVWAINEIMTPLSEIQLFRGLRNTKMQKHYKKYVSQKR